MYNNNNLIVTNNVIVRNTNIFILRLFFNVQGVSTVAAAMKASAADTALYIRFKTR